MMGASTAPIAAEQEWRLGNRCVRLARATDLADAIDVEEQLCAPTPSEPPYWMHLWPGAVALARHIATMGAMEGACVLELGCGLALPAVTAAVCGARVVASDRVAAPLPFVRRSAWRSGARVQVLQMDWTAAALRDRFDLCLGADIGYHVEQASQLANALAGLVRPGGYIWLADSVNIHRSDLLDALARVGCVLRCRQVQEQDEGRPVWVRIVEARTVS